MTTEATPISAQDIPDPGNSMTFGPEAPLPLDCGVVMDNYTIAYQTYGTLNSDKSNGILVFHALTGDQFAAGTNPVTGKDGWWSMVIGPGKSVDTDRYFIICANVIGGCMGSSGPKDINPATGQPWALTFPVITIADMVRAQTKLLDRLGIDKLFAVIGGSTGGMQALEFAASYPDRAHACVPIATASSQSAQNIALYEVGRQAIMADPEWRNGNYLVDGTVPRRGLSVARMAAHITYMSKESLHDKFGRRLQNKAALGFGFDTDFQVESYLHHQGSSFVDRFDANSYLYVTRAMDYFDLDNRHGGILANAFAGTPMRFCVVSFTSDWHYTTDEARAIVHALNAGGASVSFAEIETDKGHDAFLMVEPEFHKVLRGFLEGTARRIAAGLQS
ncbi:MAG: homoserine O-acetyltransferase MetX [Magnetospiraceae bacterium]